MRKATLALIRCPHTSCNGPLTLTPTDAGEKTDQQEVHSGFLRCGKCQDEFPILGGVAILVEEVGQYLLDHVKGISKIVKDTEIPEPYREQYCEAKEAIFSEHIEDDLEADRVNALYLMTHYLNTKSDSSFGQWWKPTHGEASPLISSLIEAHWDRGPFAKIADWTQTLSQSGQLGDTVELGCGVGGLYPVLKHNLIQGHSRYLGVDYSFASIALARHLNLGTPYPADLSIPEDLLHGALSRPIQLRSASPAPHENVDFIVSDADAIPVEANSFGVAIALNMIDMLPDPRTLPRLQSTLLRKGGVAIQSSPYIWHEASIEELRSELPPTVTTSAQAIEWLYEASGFQIKSKVEHLPWLFFKHLRQLEIYSVHLLMAQK